MLTLKKVKELVGAPSHAKRTPSPKMLYEEGIVLLRREFDQGSHLTVYNSGYVLFSAGKRNTVFHIHDCCGDYAYDAAEGKGDVIEEEYFENCEWHIRALFEGERKMEDAAEGNGQIFRIATLGSVIQISADGKQFMADNSQRESARWQEALDMLIMWGWVKSVGRKGEVYEVTGTGYTKADWLKDGMCIDTSKEPLEELKQFEV